MTTSRSVMGFLSGVILVFYLTGCFPSLIRLPERFSTVGEAFPSEEAFTRLESIPADSFKKAVFEAPFEDVFRIAEVSAMQSQFNIEAVHKSKGLILALKVTKDQLPYDPPPNCPLEMEVKCFYAIKVKEVGSKTTEVIILSKAQGACCYSGGVSVGSVVGHGLGILSGQKQGCEALSKVHWAKKMHDLTLFFTLMRNNLMAAGLI